MYGVSLQYKESANVCALLQDVVDSRSGCRYVLQRSMIPLMMQENYKPQGWRESVSTKSCMGVDANIHFADTKAFCVPVVGLIMGTRLWQVGQDALCGSNASNLC